MSSPMVTYKFAMAQFARGINKKLKQDGISKKKMDMQTALKFLFERTPEFVQSIEAPIMAEEWFWMQHSRVAIFPEDWQVLDSLLSAKYDLSQWEGFTMPHEAFVMAFPRDYYIGPYRAMGCMVQWVKNCERKSRVFDPFMRYIGWPPVQVDGDPQYHHVYSMQVTSSMEVNGQRAWMRAVIPAPFIPDILRCQNGQEYKKVMGDLHYSNEINRLDLNDDDNDYQFCLVKLLLALGVYSSAKADALEPGFPGARPKFLEEKGVPTSTDLTLSTGLGRGESRDGHWRNWHFRQLTHDRYYQGEHEGKPKGSRMVFVRGAFVGQDVEAETLKRA